MVVRLSALRTGRLYPQEIHLKLRFPDLMTTAQVGGKVVSLTHRPSLSPGNTPEVKVPRFHDNGTEWW